MAQRQQPLTKPNKRNSLAGKSFSLGPDVPLSYGRVASSPAPGIAVPERSSQSPATGYPALEALPWPATRSGVLRGPPKQCLLVAKMAKMLSRPITITTPETTPNKGEISSSSCVWRTSSGSLLVGTPETRKGKFRIKSRRVLCIPEALLALLCWQLQYE